MTDDETRPDAATADDLFGNARREIEAATTFDLAAGLADLAARASSERAERKDAAAVAVAVRMPGLLTALWRWRYELVSGVTLPASVYGSTRVLGGTTTFGICAGVALLAALPPVRRALVRLVWGLVTPHRVRVALSEAGVRSAQGVLPAIVFTRRKRYGQRVYLWLPGGLAPIDVAAARHAVAAICWARDVEVYEAAGHPQLVALEVVRRRDEERNADDRAGERLAAARGRALRHAHWGRPSGATRGGPNPPWGGGE